MNHLRAFALSLACSLALVAQSRLQLQPGDHVALVGGALADRMQHSGYFETLVHERFADNKLVFRNLAAAGDEVVTRHRSENFGSPDDWLGRAQADVILAFFGYNESFQGADALPKFRTDLDTWVKHVRAGNYSGKGSPRVVLFSPAANEKHRDANYPDLTPNNANVRLYAAAIAEVAKANSVPFVDVFEPSLRLFTAAAAKGQSLTINGFLLSDEGDKQLAPVLFEGLFGEKAPTGDMEKLRAVVNEKNWQWHQRYRTVDGYNVYGGRSALAYQAGKGGFISDRNPAEPYISNYKVMQEEMSQRDVLTANRDKRVWAVAKDGDLVVDDSNLPAVTPIESNKPGPNADRSPVYLDGQEAISKMTVHSGMKVNLFADEKQFPNLVNPVQMAWDTKGRLWIAAWLNYPERTPTSKVGDKLLVYEDTNGDGKADKETVFADDLNCPTGFQFYQDGVLVMQAPDLWFMRDTNGDGKADQTERVLMGMDSADSHHTANAICLDPGGSIYLSDGVFHRTQVETGNGPIRNNDAAIYRYEPRTGQFETYIPYGFANPHGRVFDYWGNDFVTDATGNANYFGPAFSGRLDYPAKHPGMREFWNRPSRPCPATGLLTSRHFPEEFQGNFLNLNVIGFQGIFRVKVSEDGSGLKGETLENLISSSDPNFRPIAISTGPDGAIYFADWHQNIIGHMQHHLRDPNRGHQYGRIYRITYAGRDLLKPVKIDGQPIAALLNLLKEPENQTRELAKIELGKRDTAQVIAAVKSWAAGLDKKDAAYEHHMMEALWVHQWHNVVNVELLSRMLASPEANARAAAGRVLCYWRDRVPDALARFAKLAEDENPRVRLEAVRGASFYRTAAAADVALAALKRPLEYYLEYCLKETLRQLEPYWRKAIAAGQPVAKDNAAGLGYLLKSLNTAEVMKLPRVEPVIADLLGRTGVTDADRATALNDLATLRKASRTSLLLGLLENPGSRAEDATGSLARLLPTQAPAELKAVRDQLVRLSRASGNATTRAAAWASLAAADNSFDTVWPSASATPATLTDLLGGIPLLNDADFRAKAYAAVKPLVTGDSPLAKEAAGKGGARYVRIELPRNGTLTLAEVEVFAGGQNVAPKGTARQSSTSNGGDAAKAIDGKTHGIFGMGSQTHSQEGERNPWWEVDLGSEQPVEAVSVWNRTEDNLGKRLDGFTLTLLDNARQEVFVQKAIPAPAQSVRLTAAVDAAGSLRRAAIRALLAMNDKPEEVFATLAGLVAKGDLVNAAAQGLRQLPRTAWTAGPAASAANALVKWAKAVPTENRTDLNYVEALQTAADLAGLLPEAAANVLRGELKQLRVAVFVVRTVREQMRYDTPRIVVEAGKPFEIVLENDDFMPHNMVIVKPASRELVGAVADTMQPTALDGQGRAFVPANPNILGATRLLESGTRATLKLTAPTAAGDYEYVCTFPGHWPVMWGRLIVTSDVDAYLAKNPLAPAVGVGHGHTPGE
jgi:glucose/arabinose dehydrogenase/azurin